jgi:SsrA-binding protein
LKIYFTKSFAKVQLGLGKGKTQIDKRETLKRKTAEREINRAVRDSRKRG